MLCWPQADVRRRHRPEYWPWPTLAFSVGIVLEECWRPPTSIEVSEQCRPRPTSDTDFGVVSTLVDVGHQRQSSVGLVAVKVDVGGQQFCYSNVRRGAHNQMQEYWS